MDTRRGTLVIACGALAREIAALRARQRLDASRRALPAGGTAQPARAHPRRRARRRSAPQRERYATIFVAYGDCGTGGAAGCACLREEGVERIPGAHCYEFFAGAQRVRRAARRRARHLLPHRFPAAPFRAPGDPRPRPRPPPGARGTSISRNYRRLVYLAQAMPPSASQRARAIAERLGFEFEYRFTGYGDLGASLRTLAATRGSPAWQQPDHHLLARHPGAGGRQAGPRDRQACNCPRASRRRSTARRCARARAAPMRTSPTGSAARRAPAARPEGRGDRGSRAHRSALQRRGPRAADPRQGLAAPS